MTDPIAWLHDDPERYEIIHDKIKSMWLAFEPRQVEHYTIPLYATSGLRPLRTEDACAIAKDAFGIDPQFDGNILKMVRAVEHAHGIGDPYED